MTRVLYVNKLKSVYFLTLNMGLLFILLILCAKSLYAQDKDLSSFFNEGLILYRNNQYEQARLKFMTSLAEPKQNSRITASYLMLSKVNEKLDYDSKAIEYADILITRYPQSKYIPDAYFVKGLTYFKNDDKVNALDNFLMCFEESQQKQPASLCEKYANTILSEGIAPARLETLYKKHQDKKSVAWITLWLARAKYSAGQFQDANTLLDNFLATKPEPRFAKVAQKLKQISPEDMVLPIKIGVILPLTGYYSEEATDILRGIALAIKERDSNVPKIELYTTNTKGSIVEAIKAVRSLINNNVSLIIGELEGDKTAAIAGLCEQAQIPLIIPVATDNGLTTLGSQIFQANNDLETRGKALAEYAMNQLHMSTFATLSPADDYGYALTDAFLSTIDHLGGKIISQQWYYPGTRDFKRQFHAVREAGFRHALRDSLALKGLSYHTSRIDSLYNRYDREVLMASEDRKGLVETTDIPINSIDGFFFPIYNEDISYAAPQFALANISSRPIGGDNWLDEDVLRKQRNYINGVIFVSGYYNSETDLQYRNFQSQYRLSTSSSPGIMALYGYNVMKLLISSIDAGNTTPNDIVKYIENVEDFNGIGGKISYGGHGHVNASVNILQFQDGNIFNVSEGQ